MNPFKMQVIVAPKRPASPTSGTSSFSAYLYLDEPANEFPGLARTASGQEDNDTHIQQSYSFCYRILV